jgi:hypothetical protein
MVEQTSFSFMASVVSILMDRRVDAELAMRHKSLMQMTLVMLAIGNLQ